MAKESSMLEAVQTVYRALEPMEPGDREKILASVRVLLGVPFPPAETPAAPPQPPARSIPEATSTTGRPKSPRELVQEKEPKSNAQKIALFAYYREKFERKPRFSRDDLREYFEKAKEPPPANYDRDFNTAVEYGWIHEDGNDSYLTSRGLEIVETGFGGKRASPGVRKRATGVKKKRTKSGIGSRGRTRRR